MGAALELLTAVLILVNGAKDRDDLFLRRQGDGAGNLRVGTLGGLDDGLGGLVDQLMIVGLEADADHFLCCHVCSSKTFVLRWWRPPIGTVRSFHPPRRAYQTRTENRTGSLMAGFSSRSGDIRLCWPGIR